ncbi:MAG: Ger(x)C family spore germination protein [Bacillota bacterium]
MGRKVVGVVLVMVILSLLTGCWSRKEIETLGIVSAVGVDKITINGKDKIRVTAQVIRPGALGRVDGGGGASTGPSWVVSSIADTFEEAGRDISTRSPRILFLSHSRVLVLGERVAREEGLKKVMDLLLRFRDFRLRTFVLVTRGDALDALLTEPEVERTLGAEIVRLITVTQQRVSKAFFADIRDVAMAVSNPGTEPVASVLEVFSLTPKNIIGESANTGNLHPGSPGSEQKSVRLKGLAAFRGDKLVGFLGDRETRGYLFITGKFRTGMITLRDPEKESPDRDVVVSVNHMETKIEPAIEDGRVVFVINIKVETDLAEHEGKGNVTTLPTLKMLEENISGEVNTMAMEAVSRAQHDFQSDIFGLGDHLHRKLPGEWKQISGKWQEIFPDAKVNIIVKTQIRRTGMIGDSLEIK